MTETPADKLFITYAPWINSVSLGGAIWSELRLKMLPGPNGQWPLLTFHLLSWRRRQDKKRRLWILVELMNGAEYFYSKLRRGDPVVVQGELRSHSWTTKEGKKGYEWLIAANAITRLYKPPPHLNRHLAGHFTPNFDDVDDGEN